MEPPGSPPAFHSGPAFALGLDLQNIITKVTSPKEARALPSGAVVGDIHGGVTFTDQVAAVLEQRSLGGWQELHTSSGETWTLIILNR